MSTQIIESTEESKPKAINLKMTDKARTNVLRLQKRFKKETGGRINQIDLINRVLENTKSI